MCYLTGMRKIVLGKNNFERISPLIGWLIDFSLKNQFLQNDYFFSFFSHEIIITISSKQEVDNPLNIDNMQQIMAYH